MRYEFNLELENLFLKTVKKEVLDLLTNSQRQALSEFARWLRSPFDKEFILGGLAGTGKTYLLSLFSNVLAEINVPTVFLAPTGKAVSNLNRRGVQAFTIHKVLYHLVESDEKALYFELKDYLDLDYEPAIILIDEASMVNAEIYQDLLKMNKKILFCGDINQLPPVGEDPKIMGRANFILRDIVRQAKDNSIIRLAHNVYRQKGDSRVFQRTKLPYGISQDKNSGVAPLDMVKHDLLKKADQILVYTNKYKSYINKMFRNFLHHYDYLPMKGDKLVLTKNLWNVEVDRVPLINGTIGICEDIQDLGMNKARIKFKPDFSNNAVWLEADVTNFADENAKANFMSSLATFDFGYALTVHKAQGSEWDYVIVIEDKTPAREEPRWLYTAVTRAKSRLLVFR